jgi:hypothetical protein
MEVGKSRGATRCRAKSPDVQPCRFGAAESVSVVQMGGQASRARPVAADDHDVRVSILALATAECRAALQQRLSRLAACAACNV